MSSYLAKLSARGWRRRSCVAVMLLAYLAAAIGFPMPAAWSAAANTCGQVVCCCGTVEQCQASSCGCPHVSVRPMPPAAEAPSCCTAQATEPADLASCCTMPTTKSKPDVTPFKKFNTTKSTPVRWAIGIAALKCKGVSTTWVSIGAALPLTAPYDWQPVWLCIHAIPSAPHEAVLVATAPLDPPPRSNSL